jgi:antitoxin CptB
LEQNTQAIAKLKWRCRRGTKELDSLLEGYLNKHYPQVDSKEQALFEALLEYQDSELIWYLLGDQQPQSEGLTHLVKKIRSHTNI